MKNIILLLPLLLIVPRVFAQDYSIKNDVMANGGAHSTSPNLLSDGTLGQAMVGGGTAGNLVLRGGFWATFESLPAAFFDYLPGDANMYNGQWPPQVIGSDVTYMVNYFRGLPSNIPCLLDGFWASGDANGDCSVIGSDVTRLVSYFRGIIALDHCPDYPPAWITPDDLPEEAPAGWPNCEAPTTRR